MSRGSRWRPCAMGADQDAGLDLVRFVLFSADALAAFEKELA